MSLSMLRLFGAFILLSLFGQLVADDTTPTTEATNKEVEEKVKSFGKVVDPDGDCDIGQDAGKLTIKIPGTHHDLTYTDKYTKLNAPRVLKQFAGDFSLSGCLDVFPLPGDAESSGGDNAFMSGGILVWLGQGNHIRLERAAVSGQDQPFMWLEVFEDGQTVYTDITSLKQEPIWFQVARNGNTLVFSTSSDGQTWKKVKTLETDLPETLGAGFAAINSTTAKHVVSFRSITATQP